MREIKFRVWHIPQRRMYFRGYQKVTHILLCDEGKGEDKDRGIPVRRAKFEDCVLMESSGLVDKHGHEIFEGDILRIRDGKNSYEGMVGAIPDMFRSRNLHPFQSMLEKLGILPKAENLEYEIVGNAYSDAKKHYQKNSENLQK